MKRATMKKSLLLKCQIKKMKTYVYTLICTSIEIKE